MGSAQGHESMLVTCIHEEPIKDQVEGMTDIPYWYFLGT